MHILISVWLVYVPVSTVVWWLLSHHKLGLIVDILVAHVRGVCVVIEILLFWLIVIIIVHDLCILLLLPMAFSRPNRHCVSLSNLVVPRPLRVWHVLPLIGIDWNLIVFMSGLDLGGHQVLMLSHGHSIGVHFGVYLILGGYLEVFFSLALVRFVRPVALPWGDPDLSNLWLRVILQNVRIILFLLVFHPAVARGLSLRLIYDFCLFIRRVDGLIFRIVNALLRRLQEGGLRLRKSLLLVEQYGVYCLLFLAWDLLLPNKVILLLLEIFEC